jgi:hypothetical protein
VDCSYETMAVRRAGRTRGKLACGINRNAARYISLEYQRTF